MSHIPLRDRFGFDPATTAIIETFAGRLEQEARAAYHAAECTCPEGNADLDMCRHGAGFAGVFADEVLGALIHSGRLTLDDLTSPTVAETDAFAEEAHRGQVDKAGNPYIDHPRAVAALLVDHGRNAVKAALLHDVVEDTPTTLVDLRAAGYPDEVVNAVDSVTHRPYEAYMDLIRRATADPLGRLIKLADNTHNADPDRLALLPDKTRLRLSRKYACARRVLLGPTAADLDLLEAVAGDQVRCDRDDRWWQGLEGSTPPPVEVTVLAKELFDLAGWIDGPQLGVAWVTWHGEVVLEEHRPGRLDAIRQELDAVDGGEQ